MAQFEIRRALPQDVQRITEIYNSNTEFLLHHLGRERVDRHFIAREMEEMRRVGVLDHGQAARVRGRAACAFQCAPLSGCRGECLCTAYAAGGSSTLKKYVGNPKSEEDFLRIFFISPNLLLYTKKYFTMTKRFLNFVDGRAFPCFFSKNAGAKGGRNPAKREKRRR